MKKTMHIEAIRHQMVSAWLQQTLWQLKYAYSGQT